MDRTVARPMRRQPVGFKLCAGIPCEFLCICKASLETGILPDFVNVDGVEGGTGAAPPEFSNSVGAPLVGCGLRDQIKVACAGKVTAAAGIILLLLGRTGATPPVRS